MQKKFMEKQILNLLKAHPDTFPNLIASELNQLYGDSAVNVYNQHKDYVFCAFGVTTEFAQAFLHLLNTHQIYIHMHPRWDDPVYHRIFEMFCGSMEGFEYLAPHHFDDDMRLTEDAKRKELLGIFLCDVLDETTDTDRKSAPHGSKVLPLFSP